MTRGKIDFDLGSFALAASAFEQITRNPSATPELRWEALVRLGQAKAELGEHEASVDAFREVMASHSDDTDAIRFLTLAVAGVLPGRSHWEGMWREVRLDVRDSPFPHAVMRWRGFDSGMDQDLGGKRISLHVEDESVENVVRALSAEVGFSWVLYPDVEGELTASFENVPWGRVLDLVVRAVGASVVRDRVYVVAGPGGVERLRNARHALFSGQRVTVDFDDRDLLDVLRFFADVSGHNFVALPGVAGRVNLKLDDVPWDEALFHALTSNELTFSKRDNVVVIAEPGALGPYREMETKEYHGKTISLNFKDAEMEEVLRFFENVSSLEILASEPLSEQLTFKLVDVPWDQALDLVAALNGLQAEVGVGRVRLAAR
jgi:type II secretory pathway component HofQ